jgi:hypothetical protein
MRGNGVSILNVNVLLEASPGCTTMAGFRAVAVNVFPSAMEPGEDPAVDLCFTEACRAGTSHDPAGVAIQVSPEDLRTLATVADIVLGNET